ncbi:MAG: hypothetical protein JXR78_14515, partial [Victivallales bacterium]|nr:hypothetical protein [Victivallales bacterium]
TVKLLSRLMRPLVDEGIILVSEEQAINSNLKYLSAKGTLAPSITPKLIDQKEAAEMLGLGFSNFKKLEKEGAFPFTRKMVGSAVRYRNTDVIQYIMAEDVEE